MILEVSAPSLRSSRPVFALRLLGNESLDSFPGYYSISTQSFKNISSLEHYVAMISLTFSKCHVPYHANGAKIH